MYLPRRTTSRLLLVALLAWNAPATVFGSPCDGLAPLDACDEGPRLLIDASLDVEGRRIRARTEIRFVNCADVPLSEIPILMPAALYGKVAEDLDDRNFPWRYPGGVSLSTCRFTAAVVTSGPGLEGPAPHCRPVTRLRLRRPLAPGEAMTLVLDTDITAPRRFGSFGAARGTLTLRGGWHPALPVLEPQGFRTGAGPGAAHINARVTPKRNTRVLLGTTLAAAGPAMPASFAGRLAEPLALVADARLRKTVIRQRARRVELIHTAPRTAVRDPSTPGDLVQTDWLRERSGGIRRVVQGLRDPFDAERWTLVVVPLRETLAIPGAETTFVADTLYALTDIGLLTRYHDEALAAALLTSSLRRARPKLHPWLALMGGAWLRKRLREGADLGAVRDLTRKGEFLYAIDQFGTDAQIPQEDLFFQRSGAGTPFAREAEFTGAPYPSPWTAARLLQEIAAVRALDARKTRGPSDPEGPAAFTGERWAPAFCRWVERGHREEQDLSVRVLRTRGEDRAPASIIEARRHGASLGLPVRVRIEHENGGVKDVVWDTATPVMRWRIRGRVRRATVDPDAGLLQRRAARTQDLRYDDASERGLKWVFAKPWISFTSGERIPTAYVELNLQRRHDLRSTWVLQPRLFPSRAELLLGHRWGFGRLSRPNRNRWHLTVGVKGAAGFEHGGSFSPALKTMLYFDNRRALFAPFRGGWAYGYVEGFPGDTRGGWRFSSKMGLGGAKLFGTRPDIVVALRGLADTRVGDTPAWEHLHVGGILGVRGLAVADFAPKHRLAFSAELRWMPLRNLHMSLVRAAFLRGLQLVLFTDTALLGTDYDAWFEERYLYQSAGLGLRFHADLFGVFPAVIAVDEAVVLPLYGKQLVFGTLVYFSQSF